MQPVRLAFAMPPAEHAVHSMAGSALYCPGEHVSHWESALTYSPALHCVHRVAGFWSSSACPGAHARHQPSFVAPSRSCSVPPGHRLHPEAPIKLLYLPGAQYVQFDARKLPVPSTYLPFSHPMQSVAWSLPATSTYFPASQSTQPAELLPSSKLMYLPAAHSVQLFS